MKRKYVIFFAITLFVISTDQITKYVIKENFRLGETLAVIYDFFNLTYVQNTGAAFGLFAHASPTFRVPFFIIVPLVALLSIGSIFWKVPADDIKFSTALSLVISGAIGNLIDRLYLGYVIDFLDFHWGWKYHFSVFNVADSAICIGVGLLMLDLFKQNRASIPGATSAQAPRSHSKLKSKFSKSLLKRIPQKLTEKLTGSSTKTSKRRAL